MKIAQNKVRESSKQDVWEMRHAFKRSPYRAVAFHTIYILMIYGYWFMYRVRPFNNYMEALSLFVFSSCYAMASYLNIFVSFNSYLVNRNLVRYIFFTLLTYTLTHYVSNLFSYWFKYPGLEAKIYFTSVFNDPNMLEYFRSYLLGFICFLMFTAIGVLYFMIQLLLNEEEKVLNLEKENVKSKLSQLRNQVNPHFLFNTFNNLYVLNQTDPGKAGDLIIGLSDLMHYQLHETNQEKVLLTKELDYITSYLSLEKIRKEDFTFTFDNRLEPGSTLKIEPLLLITLVENAIKHGVNKVEKGFISIEIENQYNAIEFTVKNSIPADEGQKTFGKPSGIGLSNLKNRLDILYPNKYLLDLKKESELFIAHLKIELT